MSKRSHELRDWLVPTAVLCLILAVALLSFFIQFNFERENFEARTKELAIANALRIETFFAERFTVAEIIAKRLQGLEGQELLEAYQEEATHMVDDLEGLQAVSFINAEGVIAIVTPDDESNAAAKGMKVVESPLVGHLLRASRESGERRVSPSVDLYQGGKGIAAYIPIYSQTEEHVGWLNVVYRIEDALDVCFHHAPPKDLCLVVESADNQKELYSCGKDEEEYIDIGLKPVAFQVAANRWQLRLIPSVELAATRHHVTDDIMLIVGIILALAIAWLMRRATLERRAALTSRGDLMQVLENAPFAIMIKDREGRYTYENPQSRKGREKELEIELVGKLDREILNRERTEIVETRDRELLRTKAPVINESELKHLGKIKTIRAIRFPLFDAQREVRSIVVIGLDVTEERQLVKRLREGEERYRQIYNNTPIMMHSINAEGKLVSVSDYWLEVMGYRREEVLGHQSVGFITQESSERGTKEVLPRFFAEGIVKDVPYTFVRKNGSTFEGSLTSVAEKDADGEFLRSITVIIDVTETLRLEERLRGLNEKLEARVRERTQRLQTLVEELRAFTYSVSHDLRAPLRAIQGFARLLEEDHAEGLPAEASDALSRITRNASDMSTLMDELLKLSRISSQDLNRQQVDFTSLVRRTFDAIKASDFPDSNATLEVDAGIIVRADFGLLRLLIQNLLENALKYSSQEREARIRVEHREEFGATILSVSDNGVGFDMQRAKELSRPFQRLHSADEFAGHGIGLAIVNRVIARHGGWFKAESQIGEGATFAFTLGGQAKGEEEEA